MMQKRNDKVYQSECKTTKHKGCYFPVMHNFTRSMTAFSIFLLAPLISLAENHIVKDGKSNYTIVIPGDAIEAEKTAAEELKSYLKQITGAEIPVINDNAYNDGPMIAVGINSKITRKIDQLDEEELFIFTDNNNLVIAGGRPRGVLYGVYEYLHRLGVRWFTPDYTKIPEKKDLALAGESYRYVPPVKLRSYLLNNQPTMIWTVRNRMNQFIVWNAPDNAYGGGYLQGPDMHSFWRLISEDEMRQHPEWIAEVDGKRELPDGADRWHNWSACVSNTEFRQTMIERTMEYARKNPGCNMIYIGTNDTQVYCKCKECEEYYAKHSGKTSGLLMELANELAEKMAEELPEKKVQLLSYSWCSDPDLSIPLRDNIVIMFCFGWGGSKQSCIYRPLMSEYNNDPYALDLRQRLANWLQAAKDVQVYTHSLNMKNYWYPCPSIYSTAENLKWLKQSGVKNIYLQIAGCATGSGCELADLRGWVFSRLLWNPELNVQDLINEFANDYYGPAAGAVIQSIKRTHSDVFDANGNLILYNKDEHVPNYINPKSVHEMNLMFEGIHETLTNEIYKRRLRYVWLPYLYTEVKLAIGKFENYFDLKNDCWIIPMQDAERCKRYAKLVIHIMKEENVSALGENRRLLPEELAIDKLFSINNHIYPREKEF